MSDQNPWYLESDSKPSLRMWIFSQMAQGALWGMLVFFGIILFIFALVALGSLLPEDPFAALGITQYAQSALT